MDNEKLSEIFNKNYEKHTLKKFIIEQLLKAVNAKIDIHKRYHSETNGRYINKYSYESQEYMMAILVMDVVEFKRVESEIDTWYYDKYKNEPIIEHAMPDFVYFASNKGFHKYLFFDKIINDGTRKDWS